MDDLLKMEAIKNYNSDTWGIPFEEFDKQFFEDYLNEKYFRIYKEIYLYAKVELLQSYNFFMKKTNQIYEDKPMIIYNKNDVEKKDKSDITIYLYALIDFLKVFNGQLYYEILSDTVNKKKELFYKNCKIVFVNDSAWEILKKDSPKNTLLRIHTESIRAFISNLFISGRLTLVNTEHLKDSTIRRPRKYSTEFFEFAKDIYEKNKGKDYLYDNALVEAIDKASGYKQFERFASYELGSDEFEKLSNAFRKHRYEKKKKTTVY